MVCIGCTGDGPAPTARDEYYDLEARIATDCGTYERNYPTTMFPPTDLCGAEPDVACVNNAIGGASIAHLRYSYIDPGLLLEREQNYYAGDSMLVWIGYYEVAGREPAWHRADCGAVVVEPYSINGMPCWTLKATDCVAR